VSIVVLIRMPLIVITTPARVSFDSLEIFGFGMISNKMGNRQC
jgi:hypothetical protein